MFGNVLDVDEGSDLVDVHSVAGVLGQQGANGVGDLPSAAVPNGDIDYQAGLVRRIVGRLLEHPGGPVRQQVQGANRVDAPQALGSSQVDHRGLDDRQQRLQFVDRPAQVVGGQRPLRDDLDFAVLAPAKQLFDLVGSPAMSGTGVGADGARPAPVAVENDADVAGNGRPGQRPSEPLLIQAVQEVAQAHVRSTSTVDPCPQYRAGHAVGACSRRTTIAIATLPTGLRRVPSAGCTAIASGAEAITITTI